MGWRFFKRIKILPGFYLNISKSGISLSLGVKGASVNVSKKGLRKSVGIPGTGISYSTTNKFSGVGGANEYDKNTVQYNVSLIPNN